MSSALRLACLAVALLFGASRAAAQVDLVVRVQDDANALRASLESAAAQGGPIDGEARGAQALRVSPLAPRSGQNARALRFADHVFVLSYPDSASWRAARAAWQAREGIGYVQDNGRFTLDQGAVDPVLASEPYADSLGYLDLIRAPEAWAETRGAGVRIGLLDTGLDLGHPDFAGRLWQNPGEIPGNGLDDDGNGYADDVVGYDFVDRPDAVDPGDYRGRDADPSEDGVGNEAHGTLVAGVLAAGLNGTGVAGVAPEAEIVVLRAFGRDGIAEDDDVAAALVYAAENGVGVVNASFGRRRSAPLIREAIAYAHALGTVVVASAGNAGGDAPHYPSDYPEVISVVWLAEDGLGLAGGFTGGAQYGPGVDLGAPATNVYTTRVPLASDTRPDEVRRYARVSGSSFAAPQVAGAAALLRALDPSLTPASVHGVLSATAVDLGEPGWDVRHGAGRLDVAGALGLPYPTDVTLTAPAMDAGAASGAVPVVGSAVAPQFRSWRVEWAPLALGEEGPDPVGAWTLLAGPQTVQVRADTLAQWDVSGVEEGAYLVRLVVELSSGAVLEDRRRFYVDRSPPDLAVRYLGPAYADGTAGVLVEVESDDFTRARLTVGDEPAIASDDVAPKHGVFWPNRYGREGRVEVRVEATNRAGLTSAFDAVVELPAVSINSALATARPLGVPAGYLLDRATDYDGDGLLEVVLNVYGEDGWLSDSLAVYEWAGGGFRKASGGGFAAVGAYDARTFPRDAGDTDSDGREELLLQVGPSTFLLEATEPGGYPAQLAYADTAGTPFWGARLTDLDGDGRGEVLGHDLGNADGAARWRLRERQGDAFPEVAVVENPTGVSGEETLNQYEDPYAAVGDFDGDGRRDFVSGDADGDLMVYESCGDDCVRAAFTFETGRSHAGRRFATGDFDGDGREQFVTFTTGYEAAETDDAPFGLAYLWRSTGDDAYAIADSVAFYGSASRHGSMAGADLDGDGRDELVVVHPPSLWVFGWNGERLVARVHADNARAPRPGFRSIRMAAADFDGDGRGEVAAAAADGLLYLLDGDGASPPAPPRWIAAHSSGPERVLLAWDAAGADSVAVLGARQGEPLDRLLVTSRDTAVVATDAALDVALAGYRNGVRTSLSPIREVRPYALGTVVAAEAVTEGRVRVAFTLPLHPSTRADQFRLGGRAPRAAMLGEGGRVVVLAFDDLPAGTLELTWADLRDADGAEIASRSAQVVVAPDERAGALLLASWDVTGDQAAVLRFSEPLDAQAAADLTAYRLDGPGTVVEAGTDPDDGTRIIVRVDGTILGATGRRTTLVVERMRAVSGATLPSEGAAATLSRAAADLSGVFVYPNPHRAAVHPDEVTLAGLPAGAEADVLTLGGQRVRTLTERGGDGGATWDLRDASGRRVVPGVYLLRVSAPGSGSVVVKLALVR